MAHLITSAYSAMLAEYGHRNWWPADTSFEVIVGAILTQSCSWRNVELAIANIKREKLLSPKKLYETDIEKLETLIRPSGYYKQKAKKLISFLQYFKKYNFKISEMEKKDAAILREQLLAVWGIGEETADSIICYALNKQMLVVDTYTRRFCFRLGLTNENASYAELQKYLVKILPKDGEYYKDFHAQIVHHSKISCEKKPKCEDCALRKKKLCGFNFSN